MPIRHHAHAPVGAVDPVPAPSGGLQKLQIRDLRNLKAVDIAPADSLNLVYGANASGKTSLLEAIYLLSRGRSFRSRVFERVVRKGADRYSVFGRIAQAGRSVAAAIERSGQGLRVRVDGADVPSLVTLSALLPVQILHPNSHKLLEEGPQFRRRFLDWGVFHVEPGFYGHWQRYQKALRQRNAALRQRQAMEAWETELVQSGMALDRLRRGYLSELRPLIMRLAQELLDAPLLTVDYYPGWGGDRDLSEVLVQNRTRDQERGFTGSGPHRADLRIRLEGVTAAETASRGQQKLLVCALICAQTLFFQQRSGRRAVLLVDDLPAELDRIRRQRLVALLESTEAQVFVTAIEPDSMEFGRPCQTFHVDHGVVREVV